MTAELGSWRAISLVARREFFERITSRAYQLSTLVTVLLVAGLLFLPVLFGSTTTYIVGTAGVIPESLVAAIEGGAASPDTTATIVPITDGAAVRAAVADGGVDIGIIDGTTVVTGPDSPSELVSLVTAVAAAQSLTDTADNLGIDQGTLGDLLASEPTIEEIQPGEDAGELVFLAFLGSLVLFVSIVTYGQWVLQGVIEEKSSRVVEVILGAVRPRHLLAGKVLGIGVLGLIQIVVVAVTGFIGARLVDAVDFPPISALVVLAVVGWFLLGFAFYATGYAVAGSLVSNNEDAQSASFPMTMVLMIGYFVASSALGGGDNPVLRTLSIVPPFSPLVMPLRQVTGAAAVWEVVLSIALMAAAVVGMLRIGGRIYAGGLLRSGPRSKVRDALRGAEF
ncbi:MAG: ABC transporter permease [Acidimicrobiia bacterium]|nr:ABC transporter permease [Acidimicrobiia bacterium]